MKVIKAEKSKKYAPEMNWQHVECPLCGGQFYRDHDNMIKTANAKAELCSHAEYVNIGGAAAVRFV